MASRKLGFVFTILLTLASFSQAADSSGWKVSLEPAGKIKANMPADVHVKLTDAKGKPVAGAEVELVLTMVEMDHGEFKTPAQAAKSGGYNARPTFFMVGKWMAEVRAKKGSKSVREKFLFDVKE